MGGGVFAAVTADMVALAAVLPTRMSRGSDRVCCSPFCLPTICCCCLQLLFLVKRFDEGNVFVCEEWCEVAPGNLPVWLMVKNYLLQYILLEATYLRSTCCIMGE